MTRETSRDEVNVILMKDVWDRHSHTNKEEGYTK